MPNHTSANVRQALNNGLVIPACPLALNAARKLDERRQRALIRYYLAAGAGGVAVGVHTTQFAIRNHAVALFKPVLEIVAEELKRARNTISVAGICGQRPQAIAEAELAVSLGYNAGLLSLGALKNASDHELIDHCRAVADIIPVVGFYLQPAVGGRVLGYSFWRRFAEIPAVVAIKIAPFNRYQTIDVVRAVAESRREDIALYTGNDDNILADLLTPFRFTHEGKAVERRVVGGLLGQWAVWTRRAVELHAECRRIAQSGAAIPTEMLRMNVELTDANSVIFDAANGFAGCIPGIHEVLRRQRLLEGIWCLDSHETLSPGQSAELDRVCRAYPNLMDDAFVAEHLDAWLR